jgi:hypothetical protein
LSWRQDIDTPDIPIPNPGDIDENDIADAGVTLADLIVGFSGVIAAIIVMFMLRGLWKTTPGKVLIIGIIAVVATLMVTR